MPIRDWGFCKLFEEFPQEQVNRLLEYHRQNGGLSRYVKIRYFFTQILNQEITQEKVQDLADLFSTLVKERLCDPRLLIDTTHAFIQKYFSSYNFHVVSGSDEKELIEVCNRLGIARFFVSIHGSPTSKDNLVAAIIRNNSYDTFATIMVGDSINDYEAAIRNDIRFCGFNNPELKDTEASYINNSMEELELLF